MTRAPASQTPRVGSDVFMSTNTIFSAQATAGIHKQSRYNRSGRDKGRLEHKRTVSFDASTGSTTAVCDLDNARERWSSTLSIMGNDWPQLLGTGRRVVVMVEGGAGMVTVFRTVE